MPPLPILFGPDERRLTGFYHAPAGASVRALGVVLCNPWGYEAMSAHRTYRHAAEQLAAAGIAALRFDYDGTGNSPAPSNGPRRIPAALDSIRIAIAELRARTGLERVALWGTGFGATLASLAAAEDGRIDELILWGPILSGRAHARELKAFRLFKYSKSNPSPRTDGGEEIAGYLFSRETLADISAIDLLASAKAPANRVLVLPRSDRAADEARLVEYLKAAGAEAELLADSGYAAMMRDDPYESIVPTEVLKKVVGWLQQRSAPAKLDRSDAQQPTEASVATGDRGRLRETHLLFGAERGPERGAERGPDRQLFGILTEPMPPASSAKPTICFLNVGANHNVGPHRMNVELARDLAELGYPTLRFDVAGLGESPARPDRPENRIYTKESVADVVAAMDELQRRSGMKRFVLVGLCSGSYLAFHTAVGDTRVVGQILLSPYAFEWEEGDPVTPTERKDMRAFRSTRFYASALRDPKAWRLVLRGEVDVLGIGAGLLRRALERAENALPAVSAVLRRQQRPQSEIEQAFGGLSDRGVETFIALGFEDGGVDLIAKYLGRDASRMRGRRNFKLEILHGVDHTFATIDSKTRLRGILQDYLAARFA